MRIKLEQIEADVVIVLTNEHGNGRVIPLWECEESTDQLTLKVIKSALQFSEEIGGGCTDYEIFDFRKVEIGQE